LTKEVLEVLRRALDKYAKRLTDLSNDSSLETTNEFFKRDLTSFASELKSIKDELFVPSQDDNEIRGIIAQYIKPITMVLKWYLNDLKQSEAIAIRMLGFYVPEFKTLKNEIEQIEKMLETPLFRDLY
jgi:hypothetical protein